jgi:hypothetical protein
VNTLRLRHAAIRYPHLLASAAPPTAAAIVQRPLPGSGARMAGRSKKRPLLDRLLPATQAIHERCRGCATARYCSSALPPHCGRARSPGTRSNI